MATNLDQTRRSLDAHREITTMLAGLPLAGRVLGYSGFMYRHYSSVMICLEKRQDAEALAALLELEPEEHEGEPWWHGSRDECRLSVYVSSEQARVADQHDAFMGRNEPEGAAAIPPDDELPDPGADGRGHHGGYGPSAAELESGAGR